MAITSIGYPGPIGAPEWAVLASSLGADYGVVGAGDCRVSTVPASDRTVKVSAGSAYGRGIFDVSSAEETIQLDSIVSGSRWDLVGFLRTWDGGDSATTVAKVNGTSSQTAAFASRPSTPGSSDFQPLALVQITAGNTVPTAVIDLRAWQANGGAYASDVLALQYLNAPGTEVWVGQVLWHRYVDGAGANQWSSTTPVSVQAAEVAEVVGVVGGAVRCPNAVVTLTAGTWDVEASISARTTDVEDTAAAALFNSGTGVEIASTRGTGAYLTTVGGVSMTTRPARLVITSNTNVQVGVKQNGSSTLRIVSLAVSPVAWIRAVKVA